MKKGTILAGLTLAALAMMPPAVTQAQDTLLVDWLAPNQTDLAINALYNAIRGDTAANGTRLNPNRVYKLKRGGFYYNTETIENAGFTLRIVGEKGGSTAFENPPMLQLQHRTDGSNAGRLIAGRGDIVLRNLILNGKTNLGELPYEMITFNAEGAKIEVDNCVFEYAMWGIIGVYGQKSRLYFTNNKFRNLISHNQKWGGRGVSVWVDTDTLSFENNTFFNVGGFAVQVEGGAAKHFWFNQNTLYNVGRQVLLGGWWIDAYVANNLFINGFWQGEDSGDFSPERLAQPGNRFSGMFTITPLPSRYGLETIRRIVATNNATHRSAQFENYYASTSGDAFPIRPQPFVNDSTLGFFNKSDSDNLKLLNLTQLSAAPSFTNVPPAAHTDSAIQFIKDLRANNAPFKLWYWNPGRDGGSFGSPESILWPIPENFSYSDAALKTAAVGGYPMGDLNWHPAAKATWMANRAAQMTAIKNLVGEPPKVTPKGGFQVEDGVVAGGATVVSATNKNAIRVEGAGNPYWTFTNATAGTYTIEVKHRTWYNDANPARQTDILINDVNVGNVTLGANSPGDIWLIGVLSGVALPQGDVKLTLGRSWGYMEYESVTIKNAEGGVVRLLPAARAVLNGANLNCPTAPCAGGDAFVDLKTGSVTTSFNVEDGGNYTLKLGYTMVAGTSATVNVSVNGGTTRQLVLAGAVGTFSAENIDNVTLRAGANTITITGVSGEIGVDQVDLFLIGDPTSNGEKGRDIGFALSQNYPNPFNPTTAIAFQLPNASRVTLTVFNVLGQKVATLVNSNMAAGSHTVSFDAKGLASGMYFYRLEAGTFTATKKMMLVK
jgi:hypothetical protein